MFKPIADQTAENMLDEFKKQSGDVSKSKVNIIHSNKFEEYEKAQKDKKESFKLTNSYKEKPQIIWL